MCRVADALDHLGKADRHTLERLTRQRVASLDAWCGVPGPTIGAIPTRFERFSGLYVTSMPTIVRLTSNFPSPGIVIMTQFSLLAGASPAFLHHPGLRHRARELEIALDGERQALEALERSERRIRQLVDSINEGLVSAR
jgi:hypothetical protein